MKILKYLVVFSLLGLLISACEKDDFCEESSPTPNLVLRFYDSDETSELKAAQRLSIIAQSKSDSLYVNRTVDSIAIPLNTNATETIYTFKKNEGSGNMSENETATLTISYTPEDEFLSRSCGIRVYFNSVSFQKSGWIDSLSVSTIESIKTQQNAHLFIYH